ncbi:MAG TPA: hypothetical protein VLE99_02400 [Candidatus Saccharimonadales bacterium]|nr:hypothetical protein [Candidatus Saccharimonadales bacterium]
MILDYRVSTPRSGQPHIQLNCHRVVGKSAEQVERAIGAPETPDVAALDELLLRSLSAGAIREAFAGVRVAMALARVCNRAVHTDGDVTSKSSGRVEGVFRAAAISPKGIGAMAVRLDAMPKLDKHGIGRLWATNGTPDSKEPRDVVCLPMTQEERDGLDHTRAFPSGLEVVDGIALAYVLLHVIEPGVILERPLGTVAADPVPAG